MSRTVRATCEAPVIDGVLIVELSRRVAGTSDVIDASVVVGATQRGDLVATSDTGGLKAIAQALGVRVNLHRV
jgi:hypothetical protein